MDAESIAKSLIKKINDEDMLGAKENFEKLIADKIYDRLEAKKEGLGKKLYSKDQENAETETNNETETDSSDAETSAEPAAAEEPVAAAAE
jgi:hypothetical protein